jgi:hypothetical protein
VKSVEELAYDPACERIDTAIKAIWLLFRRARWGLLAEVGMPRRQVEEDLVRFDLEQIASDNGRIRSEMQCWLLIRYCPLVLTAAMQLLGRYQRDLAPSRKRYYEELAHIQAILIGGTNDVQGVSGLSA